MPGVSFVPVRHGPNSGMAVALVQMFWKPPAALMQGRVLKSTCPRHLAQ